MKKLLLVFLTTLFISCSFDNKTGIWKDASDIPVDNQITKTITENENNRRYEDIFLQNKTFSEEKKPTFETNFVISNPIKISNWSEQYGTPSNNISNFFYNGKKNLLSKSSKLSKSNSYKKIVFYKNNLISHDHKGTIFMYSLDLNKKILKYNFYKKNFKDLRKEISFVVNKNFLYVTDNLGYLYALNLESNSIIWAKNYGIPFRSNLKFANNQLFVANQDNVIYSINAKTGDKNWQFATSLTFLKSDFENNFALDTKTNNLFFLNTSGELYSINYLTKKINWVLNFKNPSVTADTELFLGHPLVIMSDNLIISTEKAIANYNSLTGIKNWNFTADPIYKPIINSNYVYVILKNNLLVCLDIIKGDILWSKNIFTSIKNRKVEEKFKLVADFKLVNNEINIFSNNGYLLSFNPANGDLISENKISKKGISSEVIFLNSRMLFIDNLSKLFKFN
jgi:outer membrane protein assembly factor BamB